MNSTELSNCFLSMSLLFNWTYFKYYEDVTCPSKISNKVSLIKRDNKILKCNCTLELQFYDSKLQSHVWEFKPVYTSYSRVCVKSTEKPSLGWYLYSFCHEDQKVSRCNEVHLYGFSGNEEWMEKDLFAVVSYIRKVMARHQPEIANELQSVRHPAGISVNF